MEFLVLARVQTAGRREEAAGAEAAALSGAAAAAAAAAAAESSPEEASASLESSDTTSSNTSQDAVSDLTEMEWSFSFEQVLASLLNEPTIVSFFDRPVDVHTKLGQAKVAQLKLKANK